MIARKSITMIVSQFLGGLISYVGLFFIARFMGPHALGVVHFGISFIFLFSFISDLGFGEAHIKRISEGKDEATCTGTYLFVKLILTAAMVAAVLGAIGFWKYILGRGFETREHGLVLYIMLIYFVLISMFNVMSYTFLARKEIIKTQVPQLASSLARVACIIVIALLGLGVLALAGAYVVGHLALLLTGLYLFRNHRIGRYKKEYFRSYLGFALPISIVLGIRTVSVHIDRVMIQLFWSARHVGYYASVFQISNLLIIISGAVGTLLFPTISFYHARKDLGAIRKLTRDAERYISMVVFPIVIFIVIFSPQIIFIILSAEFLPAQHIFQVLAIFVLISSLNYPYLMQFGGTDRPVIGARIMAVAAIINICLNTIFIPHKFLGIRLLGLGAFGAALATLISMAVAFCLTRVCVFKLTGTRSNWRVLLHLVVAAVTGLVLYCLYYVMKCFEFIPFLEITRFYHLIGWGLITLGIYFFILYLLKEFTKEDFEFFRDTLSPKKMFRYIKEELKG